jgi:hypothetical protein
MTTPANNKLGRSEAVRWTVCFTVVVAAHALAALSLFPILEASEFEAGAPVIMLELPEAPAAPSTPPSDLAPARGAERSDSTAQGGDQADRAGGGSRAADPGAAQAGTACRAA